MFLLSKLYTKSHFNLANIEKDRPASVDLRMVYNTSINEFIFVAGGGGLYSVTVYIDSLIS